MSQPLIQYRRNKRGQNRGVVVATENGVGFALCRKSDTFNKTFGREVALARVGEVNVLGEGQIFTKGMDGRSRKVPYSLQKMVQTMEERRQRYFQKAQ